MKATDTCAAFISGYEQFRDAAYKPTPHDVWTIGFGHTRGVKEHDVCTLDDAHDWLVADMAKSEAAINRLVTVPLSQQEFDALVSLVFNIGVGAFEESTLLRKLNDKDFGGAAAEFPRWNKQKGEVLNGLTLRRAAERRLFES